VAEYYKMTQLGCAYYVNGFGCKYYVYLHTLMWYMQYLLFVTCVILCIGFVLGLEIIHWACGCSTPPFIPFSPGVNAIGGLQAYILICNSIRLCICTLDLSNASTELCNSFLSIHVILNRKVMYCISFELLCKVVWADHLLGHCHL